MVLLVILWCWLLFVRYVMIGWYVCIVLLFWMMCMIVFGVWIRLFGFWLVVMVSMLVSMNRMMLIISVSSVFLLGMM